MYANCSWQPDKFITLAANCIPCKTNNQYEIPY